MKKKTALSFIAAIAVAAFALTGCAAATPNSSPTGASTADPFRGKNITISVQYDWEPLMWRDSKGKMHGYFYDVIATAAKRLGAKVTWTSGDFAAVIPGVQSGKITVGAGTDATLARQEVVDIVPALKAGYSFIAPAKNGVTIGKSLDDLCGITMATVAGNSILDVLDKQVAKCKQEGKAAFQILTYPTPTAARLAVQSGRAQTSDTYTGETGWLIAHDPYWKVTGPVYSENFSGFAVNKQTGHAQVWANEFNSMIADGTMGKIFDKYGVKNLVSIKKSVVDPAK